MLLCNHSCLFKKNYGKPRQCYFLFVNSPWYFFFFSSSLLLRREGKAQCLLTVWVPRLAHLETPLQSGRSILAHRQPPNPKQVLISNKWHNHDAYMRARSCDKSRCLLCPLIYTDNIITGPKILHARLKGSSHTPRVCGIYPLMWYIPSFAMDVSPDSM